MSNKMEASASHESKIEEVTDLFLATYYRYEKEITWPMPIHLGLIKPIWLMKAEMA